MTYNTELIAECRDFDTSSYRNAAHANAAMTAKLQEAADALEAQGCEIETVLGQNKAALEYMDAAEAERDQLRAQVSALQADADRYKELLFCVAQKFPGESRHQTAMRYLLDREKFGIGEQDAARTKGTV